MAQNDDFYRIGQEGFEAIDKVFGRNCTVPTPQQHRHLYHRNEAPLETAPSPFLVYRRTEVSQGPGWLFPHPPPPPPTRPPRAFQFSRLFQVKQQLPPKRMPERREFPPLAPHQVEYPPQELYKNGPAGRVPAADAAAIDNFKAAQLYGGITRVDYGRFY